jgi:hypothetical protein
MQFALTRSFLVVLLPGLVVVAPWALAIATKFERLDALYKTYGLLINALLIGLAILIGAIVESVVSYIEVGWDYDREAKYGVQENWYRYLASQPAHEPVGYRYMSRMATTLYFELSLMVTTPVSLIGVTVLGYDNTQYFRNEFLLLLLALAAASIVFFNASAWTTHGVLCKTRKELMSRMGEPPRKKDC